MFVLLARDASAPDLVREWARVMVSRARERITELEEVLRDIQHRCWNGDPMNVAPDVNEMAAEALRGPQ